MKNQSKRGLAVFIALLTLLAVYLFLRKTDLEKFSPRNREVIPTLGSQQVEKIDFTYNGRQVVIEKRDSGFIIPSQENTAADKEAVDQIINNLSRLTITEEVSFNKEKWATFEVDEKAIHVQIKALGKDYEIWIGKLGPDFQSTYLRVGSDPKTYLTNRNTRNAFLKDDYRDRTIINISPSEITAFELTYQGTTIKAEKESDQWKEKTNDVDLDGTKVNNFLSKFSPLRADDFVLSDVSEGFNRPYLTVYLKTNNLESTITVGTKNKEGSHYIRTSLNQNTYTLAPLAVDSFPKTSKDLQE